MYAANTGTHTNDDGSVRKTSHPKHMLKRDAMKVQVSRAHPLTILENKGCHFLVSALADHVKRSRAILILLRTEPTPAPTKTNKKI